MLAPDLRGFLSSMKLTSYTRFAFTGRFLWWGSGKVEARLRRVR
jgi:hypothetical protein